MTRATDEGNSVSKRMRRAVVGATNRKLLKELGDSTPSPHRRSDVQWIDNYQKKVIEAAKVKAAAVRKQLQQQSKSVDDDLAEPYVANENRWMIMSYEVDIKADAVNRLNYIVRRLQAQAARRGRQLFRRTGSPRSEDDHNNRREGELPAITTTNSYASASGDLVVPASVDRNPSLMPANDAFITTWTASTSPGRDHDPSMIYKNNMLALQQARSCRSYQFQKRLERYAAAQEQAATEKDRRLLQQKGALQRQYQETLERQMAMTKSWMRRGLGGYNTLVLPQLKGSITSVWGTYPPSVVDQLCTLGTFEKHAVRRPGSFCKV